MEELLIREEFRKKVLDRDGHSCILCHNKENLAVHHIMERKLFDNGGYYVNNGASLCPSCHIEAEAGFIMPYKLWYKIGVEYEDYTYPKSLNGCKRWDKWGQEIIYEGHDGSFVVCPNEFKEKFEKAVRVARGAIREINPEWMIDCMDIVCEVNCLWIAKGYPIMEKDNENKRN
jgi:hypothetical protein